MKIVKIRIIVFLCLILLLVGSFAGCGEKGTEKTEEAAETAGSVAPSSDEFDAVLSSGDDFHLVLKRVDEYQGAYDMIGVVNGRAEWIQPLSKEHIFIREDGNTIQFQKTVVANSSTTERNRIDDIMAGIQYRGEGMFSCQYAMGGSTSSFLIYNANDNIGYDAGSFHDAAAEIDLSKKTISGGYLMKPTMFNDGFLVGFAGKGSSDWVKVLGTDCVVILDIQSGRGGSAFGKYSEGMFFVADSFYDIEGNKLIDLSHVEGTITGRPYFEKGLCQITIENNAGTRYYTEIDTTGEFQYEPQKDD